MATRELETEVVWSLKRSLLAEGLDGREVRDVLVDAHSTNLHSPRRRDLEPLGRIAIEGVYPDLVCSVAEGERRLIAAIEVKPQASQWTKGLVQAERYRAGVHMSWFAAPGKPSAEALGLAAKLDVGILTRQGRRWSVLRPAPPPKPAPWRADEIEAALAGAAIARRLNLNHPLHYLVAAWAAAQWPGSPIVEAMKKAGSSLAASSRRMAVLGAQGLGLLDRDGGLTVDGAVAVALMDGVGFSPTSALSTRRRLLGESPGLAAVGRSVFLRQPAVRLVVEALGAAGSKGLTTEALWRTVRQRAPALADVVFLWEGSEPGEEEVRLYRPTTVYQWRQSLWHVGLVGTRAHRTAGKGAKGHRAEEDVWVAETSWRR